MSKSHVRFREFLRKILGLHTDAASLRKSINDTKTLIGKMLINQQPRQCSTLQEAEFKVFSQFGDDGIIQYLVRKAEIFPNSFIEFGVEDYTESNTRFLLVDKNWKGLVMDGSEEYVQFIKADDIYWRHDLTAVCSFVTAENINSTLEQHGFTGEVGILSVDIDGNDYYVWEAINVANPVLVIVEYNSVFGEKHAITIPYDPHFQRMRAHYSGLYWGASIRALCLLANKKGYAFIGSNSAGNNAYFLRRDRLGEFQSMTAAEGYVESTIRQARDASGRLVFTGGSDRIKVIQDLPVYDVELRVTRKIGELM
jgi:hypothetical protein